MHLPQARLVLELVDRAASSKSSNQVGWISPMPDDIYGPEATILAKWVSPQAIDSPSFRICMAPTSQQDSSPELGGCGVTVWPEITESAGVYQAPVTVPNTLWDGPFCLLMKDGSGTEMRSPVFTLSPVGAGGSSEPVAGEPQAQAPLGPVTAVPSLAAFPLASSLSSAPTPSASNQISPPTTINSNALSSAKTIPVAAYAVPLSVVAAIVLLASGLFLKRRRRAEKPSRANSCKSSASRGSDIVHALDVLPRHQGSKDRKSRQSTQDTFPYPAYAQWNTPAYGYMEHCNDPPTYRADSPRPPVHHPERPRLPPLASTGSFISASGPTHAMLADYLPSPPLPSSISTPRCLLPAPQQLHLRADAPTDTPRAERHDKELYAQVARKLDMYQRSRS
ncbi:hypothetical protein DFH06DRAFT_732800 [Mycena polygramma]|nr:hypothetical protein DFH06DRAFT_732800 [Mycena polygramma]